MIQLKSNPDAGTCFRIYLPITEALPKNGDTHSHRLNSTSPKAPGRVLLVDDEEIVRTGTRMLLERLGYLVTCAGDGFEAIARFEQQARDTQAVLLDITMPGRDGFQVFKEIRNIDPTVPIILMSGYAEESATNELLEIGNPKFLEKPFTADELRQTIEAAIR